MTAASDHPGMAAADAEPVPFWRRKKLGELSAADWESLCDGCGKCCLHKLEDQDTGEIAHTEVACRLLDSRSCLCRDYKHRRRHVPDCAKLTPALVARASWLPASCAYRLVYEGRDLYWWHPLVSGDPETVHVAGVSARGRVVPEERAGDLFDHIVDWPA